MFSASKAALMVFCSWCNCFLRWDSEEYILFKFLLLVKASLVLVFFNTVAPCFLALRIPVSLLCCIHVRKKRSPCPRWSKLLELLWYVMDTTDLPFSGFVVSQAVFFFFFFSFQKPLSRHWIETAMAWKITAFK